MDWTKEDRDEVTQIVQQMLEQVLSQATGVTTAGTSVGNRIENADIGGSEGHESNVLHQLGMKQTNDKWTYDSHLSLALQSYGRDRLHFDQVVEDGQSDARATRLISLQALQNAVETANLAGKQGLRDAGVLTDRIVNVDEQAHVVEKILEGDIFKDIVAAAAAVASAINNKPDEG